MLENQIALVTGASRGIGAAILQELGKQHEVYRFDAGHGSLVIEETIRQVETALDFALRTVPPGPVLPRQDGGPSGR